MSEKNTFTPEALSGIHKLAKQFPIDETDSWQKSLYDQTVPLLKKFLTENDWDVDDITFEALVCILLPDVEADGEDEPVIYTGEEFDEIVGEMMEVFEHDIDVFLDHFSD